MRSMIPVRASQACCAGAAWSAHALLSAYEMGAPEMRFPRSVTSATVRAYCFGYKDWASGVIIVLRLLSYFLRTWVRKYFRTTYESTSVSIFVRKYTCTCTYVYSTCRLEYVYSCTPCSVYLVSSIHTSAFELPRVSFWLPRGIQANRSALLKLKTYEMMYEMMTCRTLKARLKGLRALQDYCKQRL